MSINLAQIRDAIAAMPGDRVGMTKEQAGLLIDAAERGQLAERTLINLQSITVASVNRLGAA